GIHPLRVIARQHPRVVFAWPEDIDAIARRRLGQTVTLAFTRSSAAATTAVSAAAARILRTASAVLDDRIADAEVLLRPACRIEPHREALPHDLHALGRRRRGH